MALYTSLRRRDVDEIARIYGLDLTGFEHMPGGASNTSYILKTQSAKFVLTVFDNKPLALVRKMARILRLLSQNQIPSTSVISSQSGEEIVVFKNQPIMLKTYARGGAFRDLNAERLRQAGAALAELHAIPAPDFLDQNHYYNLETIPFVLENVSHEEFQMWLRGAIKNYEKKTGGTLPKGFIHGDLFYDNILFDDNRLSAIIDFEDACNYYKIFDIGMAGVGLCSSEDGFSIEKLGAMVGGYQKKRELEVVEKAALKACVAYAAAATASWRFWKYRIDAPSPEKRDAYLKMVALADAVQAIPETHFQEQVFNQRN